MKTTRTEMFRRSLWYSCLLLFTAVLVASPVCGTAAEDRSLVGRISYVDGQLLRFVPAEKDWVATVKDAPFGMDDALYSDQNGKAEFILPNNTSVRIGSSTQLQLIALKPDVTEVDVASGIARFYNKSSNVLIKTTTPFGYVVAQPESSFDLYVGDQSAEVISLSGKVDFIHAGDDAMYEVVHGSSSLIADAAQVGSGEASVDATWDDWNVERDNLWSKRVSVRGESVKYLPAELRDEAYELEENGSWETVNYEGKERHLWRPTRVASGWAPFTTGRWTEYYGDNTWVPDEPFGYATHHYGNWVYVNNAWYWGPPETTGGRLAWYPGRVAWIGSGADVGWVPLAPSEPYYSHHSWGPAATVIGTAAAVGVTIGTLAYLNHAVVVPQRDFYGVNNYSRVRVTNIDRTVIVKDYKAAPVVNTTIFKDYNTDRNRYKFTNVTVADKPHNTVLKRIEHNQGLAKQEGAKVNADTLKQNITRAKPAPLPTQTKMAAPKVTSKIVPESQMNKPASEVKFQPKELKEKPKPVQGVAGQPAVEPGKTAPGKPGEKMQPIEPKVTGTGPATSPKPGETVPKAPGVGSEPLKEQKHITPVEPAAKPMMKPGETIPKAPGAGSEPLKEQKHVTPAEPAAKPMMQGGPHSGQPMMKPGETIPKAPGAGSEPLKEQKHVTPAEPAAKPMMQGGPHSGQPMMKPGETVPKAPGAGSEPLKEQKHVTPAEPAAKPMMQGGPHSGQPMMKPGETVPKAPGAGSEPLKEQKHVTPAEPAAKPMMQGGPQSGQPMMKPGGTVPKAPGVGSEPLKEQKHITPAEPAAKPMMQKEPQSGQKPPQQQGVDKEKSKQKGPEQQQ